MAIWDQLINFQTDLVAMFDQQMDRYQEDSLIHFDRPDWSNTTWRSSKFRRAHVEVIDARETNKIWIMHACIFPQIPSGAPIYGFDIIAGPSKITGTFHDFSPIDPKHPAMEYFCKATESTSWSRQRDLPDWAREIFSSRMIAAGNIKTDEEVQQLMSIATQTTRWYLEEMCTGDAYVDSKYMYNRYAKYQKKNPHTPRTLKALGYSQTEVDFFFNHCLFPEI